MRMVFRGAHSCAFFFAVWRSRETRLTSLCGSVRHPGGRVTFSACPEKVTKERHPGGTPALRAGSLRAAGVPLTAHPVPQRNERDPSRSPARCAGLIRPSFAAPHGPTSKAKPKQSDEQRRWVPPFAGTTGRGATSPLSRLRDRVRVRARWLTVSLNVSFCGQDGRALLFPGSLSAAARTRRTKPAGARARCARVRCQAMDGLSANLRSVLAKSPGRSPATAAARVPLLFGYFLLHKQEKVTPSQGCEGSSQGRESGFVTTPKNQKTKADGFRLPPE